MLSFIRKNFLLNLKIIGAKKLEKMCYLSLVLLLVIHKIKKILILNLEGVKELELKKI